MGHDVPLGLRPNAHREDQDHDAGGLARRAFGGLEMLGASLVHI